MMLWGLRDPGQPPIPWDEARQRSLRWQSVWSMTGEVTGVIKVV